MDDDVRGSYEGSGVMYALFLNNEVGDNVDFTDEMPELSAKLVFIDWWPRVEQGWSLIIKRVS